MLVDSDEALLRVRPEYLRAVHEGASSFEVEFAAGVFGRDMADVSLAPPDARQTPPIDVVLRGEGVLEGVPLQVTARSVVVEGVTFRGALRPALRITAAQSIALRGVTVLDVQADEHQRAVVELVSGAAGTTLSLDECVIADSDAPRGALLGLSILDAAWFDTAVLQDVTLAARHCEWVLMIEALRSLDARQCRIGGARVLIRMAWPGERAELADCVLASDQVLEVVNPAPVQVEPMRLTEGTRVSAPLDALGAVVADDTVVSAPGLDREITAAVAARRVD